MDPIDQIDLRTLRLFTAAARCGSFSEAARQMGLPRRVASKLIGDLERALGGKLFRRTTRRVALTDMGEELLARIGDSLSDLHSGLAQTHNFAADKAGVVKFSASHAFGRRFVVPLLAPFQTAHPEVRIELLLHDDLDDLIATALDFTIRLGPLPESGMISRRLGRLDVALVAAPDLIKRRGGVAELNDLRSIPAIGFRIPGTGALLPWAFRRGEETFVVDPAPFALTSNSIEGVADMVRAGLGAAPVPRWLVEADMSQGRLLQLLPEHRLSAIPVHLCFADRELMPRRVRLLIDHLAHGIGAALRADG